VHLWSPAPGRSSVAHLRISPRAAGNGSELGNIVISEQGVMDAGRLTRAKRIYGRERPIPTKSVMMSRSLSGPWRKARLGTNGPATRTNCQPCLCDIGSRALSLPVGHFTSTSIRIQGWIQHSK
jgi:hypothetical protein